MNWLRQHSETKNLYLLSSISSSSRIFNRQHSQTQNLYLLSSILSSSHTIDSTVKHRTSTFCHQFWAAVVRCLSGVGAAAAHCRGCGVVPPPLCWPIPTPFNQHIVCNILLLLIIIVINIHRGTYNLSQSFQSITSSAGLKLALICKSLPYYLQYIYLHKYIYPSVKLQGSQ